MNNIETVQLTDDNIKGLLDDIDFNADMGDDYQIIIDEVEFNTGHDFNDFIRALRLDKYDILDSDFINNIVVASEIALKYDDEVAREIISTIGFKYLDAFDIEDLREGTLKDEAENWVAESLNDLGGYSLPTVIEESIDMDYIASELRHDYTAIETNKYNLYWRD